MFGKIERIIQVVSVLQLDPTAVAFKSLLHEMTQTTPTCLWNDSAAFEELTYSIEHGAVGATCNPVIVLDVLKQEMHLWKGRIAELIRERPAASEREIAWALVEEISATRAGMLKHIFDAQKGKNGRLSIQTDPILYRNTEALIQQATRFAALAPNMIVKIPATAAGIAAFEEVTYRGISVNATVSFSLPQCVAVAEAVERGLQRREREGLDISTIGPVCTIMVGRLDDWLKVQADRRNITTDPGYLEWAGVAVFKKTYRLFQERGYRIRLLSAAYRNHMHWSEFIGGDVVVSPPCKWQKRFNASDVPIENRIATPVDPRIVNDLVKKFPDFGRAYTEGGIAIQDFDTFGPTARTLRQFIEACHELEGQIREFMIPNPDKT
jgi:transaldolase